jgi:hypothetical protein
MIQATRNGTTGQFSEADWKSGVPQKKGWMMVGVAKKTLPKEIIGMAFSKARKPEVKAEKPVETIKKEVKSGNPKPKNRKAGKRKS